MLILTLAWTLFCSIFMGTQAAITSENAVTNVSSVAALADDTYNFPHDPIYAPPNLVGGSGGKPFQFVSFWANRFPFMTSTLQVWYDKNGINGIQAISSDTTASNISIQPNGPSETLRLDPTSE